MPSRTFINGFRKELANRSFALIAVRRMAERLQGDERHVFWQTYRDLELFNAPRYAAAARSWGLEVTPSVATRLKGWAVSSAPKCLFGPLMKSVHRQTVDYLDWLYELRQSGPAEAAPFLDYMVEQEALQVDMMRLALSGRYAEITRHADDFFLKYNGVIPDTGHDGATACASH